MSPNNIEPVHERKSTPHHEHDAATPLPQRSLPSRIRAFLDNETYAGLLLMGVAALALVFANSPLAEEYRALADTHIGWEAIGLNLSIEHWASDGILTIFFFVVGLELKTEFVTGGLRDIRQAALPMLAAAFGVMGPALVYTVLQLSMGSDAFRGWAIPTATDIAFAVALLGIFGKGLPRAARTFLLTLAVVDDLIAIVIIAVAYSSGVDFLMLGCSFAAIALFALLTNRRITSPFLLIPIAVLAWYFMLRCGVHATISGVALGMVVPAKVRDGRQMSVDFAWRLNPWSLGLALPIFAFFAAGVSFLGGEGGLAASLANPIAISIAIALPVGKFIGIWGSVSILTKTTKLRLGDELGLRDIAAIAVLGGVGFTVAMLVAGLAFTGNVDFTSAGRFGVILGTLISTIIGGALVHMRARHHNKLAGLID